MNDQEHYFQIGDAVKIHCNGRHDGMTGIIESIDYDENCMVLFNYLGEETKLDFNPSLLEFMYHDKAYADIFMESVRNGLPTWKGDVYNYFEIIEKRHELGIEFEEDTIPIEQMKHIIEHHAFRKRMEIVYSKYKDEIMDRLHWSKEKLYDVHLKLHEIMIYINDPELNGKNKKMKKLNLDDQEWKFVLMIQTIDKDEFGMKDHFPIYMSDYNIMRSIKQAYANAEKVEAQRKGQQLYEGVDRNKLRIQFYFDEERKIIQTAYPVFVDSNNRPDLRHPKRKDKN